MDRNRLLSFVTLMPGLVLLLSALPTAARADLFNGSGAPIALPASSATLYGADDASAYGSMDTPAPAGTAAAAPAPYNYSAASVTSAARAANGTVRAAMGTGTKALNLQRVLSASTTRVQAASSPIQAYRAAEGGLGAAARGGNSLGGLNIPGLSGLTNMVSTANRAVSTVGSITNSATRAVNAVGNLTSGNVSLRSIANTATTVGNAANTAQRGAASLQNLQNTIPGRR